MFCDAPINTVRYLKGFVCLSRIKSRISWEIRNAHSHTQTELRISEWRLEVYRLAFFGMLSLSLSMLLFKLLVLLPLSSLKLRQNQILLCV